MYGTDRLSLDRYNGCSGYYLYDPRGSVTGITNERGQLYQSYRYDANGGLTYGAPQYENEYTYNGESYNPNIESQYLRARYYDVVTAVFLTEDTYLGNIIEPLTLNRYNYCVSSPLNYVDPSGNTAIVETLKKIWNAFLSLFQKKEDEEIVQLIPQPIIVNPTTTPEVVEPTPEASNSMQETELNKDIEDALDKEINVDCDYGNEPQKIDGWIKLYSSPTVQEEGRSVLRHKDANRFDWGMPEEVRDINKYAREQMETNGAVVEINQYCNENANIFTDAEGRYWVAVGPRVLNPNVDLTKSLRVEDFAYGTKIDIHVQDNEGNEYYIPAVVGDIKAHSAPDGLYQTGIEIPNNESADGHGDGSTVEFMGTEILTEVVKGREKSCVNRTNGVVQQIKRCLNHHIILSCFRSFT